ncbi:MAG: YraN family protein [Dethiobacteria bacterium]
MKNKRERGMKGERLAADYLRSEGYEIIMRNYRCPIGEIDLIARQGNLLVFVEVRSRWTGNFGSPEQSISDRKKNKLIDLANYYLSSELQREVPCRFDFIGIKFNHMDEVDRINHITGIT